MALQIARVAKPSSEAAWLTRAVGSTVTAMRDLVRLELGEGEGDEAASEPEERCTLTVTADTEDVWLFECVRLLVQQMAGGTANEVVDALLGEASSSLFERVPKDALDLDDLAPRNDAQNAWNRQLAAWRLEAERLCEPRIPRWGDGEVGESIDSAEFDLPHLANAVHVHAVGYEAARVVAGVATPETDAAWTQRAIDRTIVHLREDVAAAEHLARVGQCSVIAPPEPDTVTAWLALRSCVITGAVFRDFDASQTALRSASAPCNLIESLRIAFATARHLPPHLRSRGRETIRLRVAPDIRALYRGLERLYQRHGPTTESFLRFACVSVIEQWARERPDYEYAHIYLRDGLRCTNPVCSRRDVTPHHIRFRSHGGGHEDTNLTSPCLWCHLQGVHLGRLEVTGDAPALKWRIAGHTVVDGRTRRRAA